MTAKKGSFPDEVAGARYVEFSGFAAIARRHAAAIIQEPLLARDHAAIAIVFGHAAVEFYINEAGGRLLGDGYFKDNIERAEIKAKWAIVSRMAGQRADPGGAAMHGLARLVKARNGLMHAKVTGIKLTDENVNKVISRLTEGDEMVSIGSEVPLILHRLRLATVDFDPPPDSLADEFL